MYHRMRPGLFNGTMREFVNCCIHTPMNKSDIDHAIAPFIDPSKMSDDDISDIREHMSYLINEYFIATKTKQIQAGVWRKYLNIRDYDSQEAEMAVRDMVMRGREYQKELNDGYYDQMDQRYWNQQPVSFMDFQYLVQYETQKAYGKGCMFVMEAYEFQRQKKSRYYEQSSRRGRNGFSSRDESRDFLTRINYPNPNEKLITNNQTQWREIKGLYRKKARDLHPDKHPDRDEATEEFQEFQDRFDKFKNTHYPNLSTHMRRLEMF